MSERRTAPRSLKPAETTALTLGVIAVLGNLVVALSVPVPPPDLTLCLVWLIALTFTLNLNIAIENVEINFVAFFVLSAFMLFGSGAAIGIFVSSLLLSEIVNHLRQRLRAAAPRDAATVDGFHRLQSGGRWAGVARRQRDLLCRGRRHARGVLARHRGCPASR